MKQMIGISVGSQNTVVGVLKNSNVDIILSDTSSRCVPTISAFSERERTFGDQALFTVKSNYNRTLVYPNRWLGMQPDWPFMQEEAKYATAQPVVDKHNKVGFEINYKGEQEVYYPEQCMGVFFNKLKQNWKKAGYDTKEVVVSVPDYFTSYERKAMLDALTIADLQCTSLINESSAIALEYGLKRRIQFDEKTPKIVGFIDMGQSKTTISFASFTKNNQKVISVTSERFCGARDFDYLLMQFFCDIFKKKYGCNPMNSAKCRIRLMEAIAKTRKILSANKEASLNVESLMEDEDLNYNLTRDEFEKIISPVLEKFRNLLKTAITNAMAEGNFQLSDLGSVEMVGDAVRTPVIQQIIKEVYGLELSKTLLPDECIARGATFYAAMNSPFFTLKDFNFEHYNPYSIILEYPFLKDGQVQIRTHLIIKKGENIPNRKSIKFSEKQTPKQDVIQLRFFYNNEELSFINNTLLSKLNFLKSSIIETYMTSIPHVKEEQWTLALQFYLDHYGLPHLDKAAINEVYYEEVPVKTTTQATTAPKTEEKKENSEPTDASENKPEEKKVEKVKKERSTLCIVKLVECLYGLQQAVLDQITQKEASQENDDRLLVAAINKRNEIENFIYSTRPKLESELSQYVNNQEKEELLKLMQQMEDWLYSGDEAVYNKSVLEEKGKDLNELGTKIYKRHHDWEKLEQSLSKLEQVINLNKNKLKDNSTQSQLYNQNEKDEFGKLIAQYNNMLNEGRVQFTKFPKFSDPPARYEDVDKASEEFVKKCSQILINAEKRQKDELKRKEEEEKRKLEEEKKKQEAEGKSDVTMSDTTGDATDKKPDINMDVD